MVYNKSQEMVSPSDQGVKEGNANKKYVATTAFYGKHCWQPEKVTIIMWYCQIFYMLTFLSALQDELLKKAITSAYQKFSKGTLLGITGHYIFGMKCRK